MKKESIKSGAIDSLPALFGYFPLGLAFGILAFNKTGSLWIGPLMSLCVYAGAAQFLCMNVMLNNGSLFDVALTTFVVNLRHIFYGIPFLTAFNVGFFKKLYLIFGITDETYSILSSSPRKFDTTYSLWVTGLTHGYWLIGTLLGGVLGAQISYDLSALEFALIALFIVLAIEQAYHIKDLIPFVLAGLSFLVCLSVPDSLFLSTCMCVCLVLMLGDFKVRGVKHELS